MNMNNNNNLILKSDRGIEFKVNDNIWRIPPVRLSKNEKICFISSDEESSSDSSVELCKIISSLEDQVSGDYFLFGNNTLIAPYSERLDLRKRIGYIQSYGGLFSNRSVKENLSFPLSIHTNLEVNVIDSKIEILLNKFNLNEFRDLKPHEIDGLTRWRTCAARALIMEPELLIIEGVGDWHYKKDISYFWDFVLRKDLTIVVSLTGTDSRFQEWFTNECNGKLVNIELARVII